MILESRKKISELHEKIMMYMRLQRYQAAEDALNTAIEEYGPLANLLNLLGTVHHRQSRFSQAIEYFEKAKLANPDFIEASLNLAVTMSDLGFYDQAEVIYFESLSLTKQCGATSDLVLGRIANLHCQTAFGYEEAGLLQKAIDEYSKALELYPRLPDIRLRLAKLYLKNESFHQSQEQLKILVDENPSLCESLNLLGYISFKMGEIDEAIKFWQKAQNNNPNDRCSRAYLHSLRGDTSRQDII